MGILPITISDGKSGDFCVFSGMLTTRSTQKGVLWAASYIDRLAVRAKFDEIQWLIRLRCSEDLADAHIDRAFGSALMKHENLIQTKIGPHAAFRRQPRLSVHRAAAARAFRRGRRGGLQGGGAAGALRPHAGRAQGRDRQAWTDAAWHQHLRRRPARRFRIGRGAGARARLGRRVQAGARIHGGDRRQRDPLHGRHGADGAAAGGGDGPSSPICRAPRTWPRTRTSRC